MAEIPDELEKELMHQILDRRFSCVEDVEGEIRDAIQTAYAKAWERCEEHMRQTVGEWHESRPIGYS